MVVRTRTRPGLPVHGLWLALMVAAFAPTAAWLWERWTLSVWHHGHGLFVGPVVAYLAWQQLRGEGDSEPEASPWGFAFLVPGLALLALDTGIRTQILSAIGLVLCLPGLSLLLLGVSRTRRLALPLTLAAFMLPIPAGPLEPFYMALRIITAWGSAELVQLWGIPVFREGTTLTLPNNIVQVVDACSGASALYASLFLALILAYRAHSNARRATLLAVAPALAMVSNIVRVFVLVLIVHYRQADLLKTPLHETSGMVTFVVVIIGLFIVAEWRAPRGATV